MPTQAPIDSAFILGQSKPYLAMYDPYSKAPVPIDFQFPPLVKSDSKGANWQEYDTRQAEPYPLYKGGLPRIIDLRWTYIVNNQYMSGVLWDISRVEKNVKQIRAYFYNYMSSAKQLIRFRAYDQVGGIDSSEFDWTFRGERVDISHSDTLIRLTTTNIGLGTNGIINQQFFPRVYPLRTDITLSLKFYVNPKIISDSGYTQPDGLDLQETIKIEGIKSIPSTLTWF